MFSFFSRKGRHRDRDGASRDRPPGDAADGRRPPEAQGAAGPVARELPAPDSLEARRAAARLTEEKINQIESEMIAVATTPAAIAFEIHEPSTGASLPVAVVAPPTRPITDWFESSGAGALGNPSAMAVDINASSLPGELEEVAILFANGQPDAAAASLHQALADADLGSYQQLAWLMLLDLHQLTAAKAEFESLALDYAARFESSPPAWIDEERPNAAAERQLVSSVLAFPAQLDDSVASRIEMVERALERRREATIDFGPLQSVDADGATRLLALFRRFDKASPALRQVLIVRGAQRLLDCTRAAIEPGRRDPADSCWMLALYALRLLGEPQAFEDLGIEYCVTYEVSPPSWEALPASVRCAADAAAGEPGKPKGAAAPARISPPAEPNAFLLSGEIIGRMQGEIQALRAFSAGRSDVVVDCRALRRIEFVAAGELLNEVFNLRSAGKQLLFLEPNRLVYALMLVMGIQELADVRRRKI